MYDFCIYWLEACLIEADIKTHGNGNPALCVSYEMFYCKGKSCMELNGYRFPIFRGGGVKIVQFRILFNSSVEIIILLQTQKIKRNLQCFQIFRQFVAAQNKSTHSFPLQSSSGGSRRKRRSGYPLQSPSAISASIPNPRFSKAKVCQQSFYG